MLPMKHVWESRLNDARYNTSYPLKREDWSLFQKEGALPFNERRCAFYIHIPFCKRLCSFCEYTKMLLPTTAEQQHYIAVLSKDIQRFLMNHPQQSLYGFDIGGGTPTALCDQAFEQLLNVYQSIVEQQDLAACYEPSIEGTFATISENKVKKIVNAGIQRLSLGLQSSSTHVLARHNRSEISRDEICKKIEMVHALGIKKINLDVMYGLEGQDEASINADLNTLKRLKPEQVTLYEWRTNMLAKSACTTSVENFQAYEKYYLGLKALGYMAKFGQNTFSLSSEDMGCSSYLRHRMLDGAPYKGFGISAQSMSSAGVSYNYGKGALKFKIDKESYECGDVYLLPPSEIAAKYISIAAYCGRFSLSRLSEILQQDAKDYFKNQIDFVLNEALMQMEGDTLCVTRKGFLNYGATFSLFSSMQK